MVNNVFTHNGSFINARISSNRNNLNQPITNATAGLHVYSSNDNGVTVEYVGTTVSGVNNNNDPNTIRLQVGGTSTQAIVDELNARDLDGYQIWIANDGIGTTETTFDAELANIQVDGDLDVEANATVSGDLTVTGDIISDSLLTVTANPAGTDGASLTRIEIDGVNYNIASGGHTNPTTFDYTLSATNLRQETGSVQAVVITAVSNSQGYTFDITGCNAPTGWTVSGASDDDQMVTLTPDAALGAGTYTFRPTVTSTHTSDSTVQTHTDHVVSVVVSAPETRENMFYGFSMSTTISSLNDLVTSDGTTTGGVDTGEVEPSSVQITLPGDDTEVWYVYLVVDSSVTLPHDMSLTAAHVNNSPVALVTGGTITGRNVYRLPIPNAGGGSGTWNMFQYS